MTVLLSRSLEGFATGVQRDLASTTGASLLRPKRAVAFFRTSKKGIVMLLMVLRRHPPDFFQGRDALLSLLHAHHAQRFHPFGDRLVFNDRRGSAFDDEPADRFR